MSLVCDFVYELVMGDKCNEERARKRQKHTCSRFFGIHLSDGIVCQPLVFFHHKTTSHAFIHLLNFLRHFFQGLKKPKIINLMSLVEDAQEK